MNTRARMLLVILGFLVTLLPAAFENAPGYMDAEYYLIGGQRLAQGHGFSELVLWNYLDDPSGLPHPSHGYWMPLPSILAAVGMALTGRADFASGRLAFILLAALIPWLTAEVCFALTRNMGHARLAGGLALVPGFYLAYLPTTDAFTPVMVFGGLFFWSLIRVDQMGYAPRFRSAFGLGILIGLMHLCRADGLIWLAIGGAALLWASGWQWRKPLAGWGRAASSLAGLACGYVLVFGPWALRNLDAFGTPLSPGGSKALWIVNYNELFSYPADRLTFGHWLEAGWKAILQARLEAMGQNILSTLVVMGSVFLLPLILAGAWRFRRSLVVRSAALTWLLILAVMSIVFPFQGLNGGFFHSTAALQSLCWALAPVGLESFLEWGRAKRGWQLDRSRPVFQGLLLAVALLLTLAIAYGRMIGPDLTHPAWNHGMQRYQRAEAALQGWGAQPGQVVMVNSPPGYYAASQRPAVALPFTDLSVVQQAAQRYQAVYLLIDIDQILGENLVSLPGDRPGLHYLGAVDDLQIYRFEQP